MRYRRLHFEWKPQDCWIGVFWKRSLWYGGFEDALAAVCDSPPERLLPRERQAHRTLDVWVCFAPMVPLHYRWSWCPRPALCRAQGCDVARVQAKANAAPLTC